MSYWFQKYFSSKIEMPETGMINAVPIGRIYVDLSECVVVAIGVRQSL